MKLSPRWSLVLGAGGAAALVLATAYLLAVRDRSEQAPDSLSATVDAQVPPSTEALRIFVGEQAQKNLRLTARRLQVESFWRTLTVPGMIVPRPGVTEREVVAPAVGTVQEIFRVPGDAVRPGDELFTLRLASESLHQSQSELFKASQDIQLAQTRLERLTAAGEGVPRARVIEVQHEIARLEVAVSAYREDLLRRGLSSEDIDGVQAGRLATTVVVRAPQRLGPIRATPDAAASMPPPADSEVRFELRQLLVESGQQVQAGQALCDLIDYRLLAIEGHAFPDEATLLERSLTEGWPVEVDFLQDANSVWPAADVSVPIRYVSSTIDPESRTFSFLLPLVNQEQTVVRGGKPQTLWRFRPGQRVLLRVRVERLDGVFVLPADAVAQEGGEVFVFQQNVNVFERRSVHLLLRDRHRVVIADDGALATFPRGTERWTMAAIVQNAAPQLARIAKSGSPDAPKGFHVHADGSLHKNEDEGR